MDAARFDADCLALWPVIPWLEPIAVTCTGGATGLGCRLCIARHGLKGRDVTGLWQMVEEHRTHLEEYHAEALEETCATGR